MVYCIQTVKDFSTKGQTMMIIKCQHSALEFEAKSKRSKNHPLVSELKTEANQEGNYREVCQAIDKIKVQGKYTTAEEFVQQVRLLASGATIARLEREQEWQRLARQDEKRHREAKAKRAATNRRLRAHGYTWHKEDEESMDHLGPNAFSEIYGNRSYVWILTSSDGRVISVKEALAEIEAKHA
jgi:hypothetical protein